VTEDITEMSLEVECSEEYTIEQGTEALEGGVKVEVKQKLEDLLEDTRDDAYELAGALNEQIESGQVELETRGRLIIIRIREKGSFISGSAEMAPAYTHLTISVKLGAVVFSGGIGCVRADARWRDIAAPISGIRLRRYRAAGAQQ